MPVCDSLDKLLADRKRRHLSMSHPGFWIFWIPCSPSLINQQIFLHLFGNFCWLVVWPTEQKLCAKIVWQMSLPNTEIPILFVNFQQNMLKILFTWPDTSKEVVVSQIRNSYLLQFWIHWIVMIYDLMTSFYQMLFALLPTTITNERW